MGRSYTGRMQAIRVTGRPVSVASRVEADESGGLWETRLYVGIRVASVPQEIRLQLAQALGGIGVEAEFFVALANTFLQGRRGSHEQGEIFLLQLEAAGLRLLRAAASLEVATQGYLTALETGFPGLIAVNDVAEPWWPPFAGYAIPGEPLEVRLRRCSYAYRHVVTARLHANVEAIAERLAFTLHTLITLPPAGVVPAQALYSGLYELSAALQGDIIPHYINDVSAEAPGLLSGIALLRALDAREDTALEADIAWAQAQFALARATSEQLRAMQSAAVPEATVRWAAQAVGEWEAIVELLESMRGRVL
ncbi:MAG TPA: hypothetical protein VGP82_03615 [Ktedonobacterales bacterium]|nr:hypothetical protein [Ktedonobacterales bacterium]